MLSGGFPGQLEAIQQRVAQIRAEAEEAKQQAQREVETAKQGQRHADARASRRLFLGLAFGGCVGACAGGGAVQALRGPAPATPPPPKEQAEQPIAPPPNDPELQFALQLAAGPIDKLVAEGHYYLAIVDSFPAVAPLWTGVHRLGLGALDAVGEPGKRLREHVVVVLRRPDAPEHLAPLTEHLQRHLDRTR